MFYINDIPSLFVEKYENKEMLYTYIKYYSFIIKIYLINK